MAKSLSERDKNFIWHPYTAQKYTSDSIPVVKGEGAWLFDETGHRFIDAISSWWVTIHGHAHPYIAEAIYRQALQLEQVIFAGFTHAPAVELAERLLPLLPGSFSKIFYSDNGSTAVEVAIKMALQYWWNKDDKKRKHILALRNGYHGDTFGAMSVSNRGIFNSAFEQRLFEVLYATTPDEENTIEIIGLSPEETLHMLDECACVIYEPLLQGAGGMQMYSADALNNFLVQCKRMGIVCIADEVMTGFGRTGKLFASAHCSEKPDIICLSKGITGGAMALGATACTEKIHEAFIAEDPLKTFFHGHSYTANPLACRAALASLDLFERPETMENLARICTQNEGFLTRLKENANELNIRNARQCGTIVAFEINADQEGYTSRVKERITSEALKKGVYVRPLGNTVYIMPPYCITDDELQLVYDVVSEVIKNEGTKKKEQR